MGDKLIFIFILLVFAINSVFIWMRIVLKRKGLEYPWHDRSWSVFYAYLDLKSRDKKLRVKLRNYLILLCLIFFTLSILILIL